MMGVPSCEGGISCRGEVTTRGPRTPGAGSAGGSAPWAAARHPPVVGEHAATAKPSQVLVRL